MAEEPRKPHPDYGHAADHLHLVLQAIDEETFMEVHAESCPEGLALTGYLEIQEPDDPIDDRLPHAALLLSPQGWARLAEAWLLRHPAAAQRLATTLTPLYQAGPTP